MAPNWRCIWGKITRSTGLRGLSSHDVLFYSWGFTQPDAWGLLRRADAKGAVFPYRSTEGQVQKAIDVLIERGKLCQHQHDGHEYIHWCNWDDWQPETVRWRTKSNMRKPFDFVCPNECEISQDKTYSDVVRASPDKSGQGNPDTEKAQNSGVVRTSPLETETETETKGNTPLKPPLSQGGAAGQTKRRRRRRETKDRDEHGNPIPGAHSGRYAGIVQR